MTSQIDVVRCFHNTFRKDIAQIDFSVLEIGRNGGNLSPILNRLHSMDEILDYHSRGEETVVFPAVDNVAPLVAMAYQMDNRELYKMGESIEARPLSVRFAKQISTSSFPICSQKTLKPHIGEHTLQEVIMI